MSTDLSRMEDTPTHKLIVKLEDGTFRTFYLTVQEAEWVVDNINSVEPNIVLPQSIDRNYPSFYPKRGAWMERMKPEEIESRRKRYTHSAQTIKNEEEEERRKAEQTHQVNKWIEKNPNEWMNVQKQAEQELYGQPGIFHAASDGTKDSLIKIRARSIVRETYL